MQSQNNQNSFKKGQSGNPSGRPRKTTDQKFQEMLEKTSPKVINTISKAVKKGEPWAIELCFKELAKDVNKIAISSSVWDGNEPLEYFREVLASALISNTRYTVRELVDLLTTINDVQLTNLKLGMPELN